MYHIPKHIWYDQTLSYHRLQIAMVSMLAHFLSEDPLTMSVRLERVALLAVSPHNRRFVTLPFIARLSLPQRATLVGLVSFVYLADAFDVSFVIQKTGPVVCVRWSFIIRSEAVRWQAVEIVSACRPCLKQDCLQDCSACAGACCGPS